MDRGEFLKATFGGIAIVASGKSVAESPLEQEVESSTDGRTAEETCNLYRELYLLMRDGARGMEAHAKRVSDLILFAEQNGLDLTKQYQRKTIEDDVQKQLVRDSMSYHNEAFNYLYSASHELAQSVLDKALPFLADLEKRFGEFGDNRYRKQIYQMQVELVTIAMYRSITVPTAFVSYVDSRKLENLRRGEGLFGNIDR